jgi:hypothetical protein
VLFERKDDRSIRTHVHFILFPHVDDTLNHLTLLLDLCMISII